MNTIKKKIKKAKTLLKKGEFILIPTETVYGLAGNAYNKKTVKKIFNTKKRPKYYPIVIQANSVKKIFKFINKIPFKAIILIKNFWPGPLTLILKKNNNISNEITSNFNKIGIRIPRHPIALKILSLLKFPLIATSANLFKNKSPIKSEEINIKNKKRKSYLLEGGKCFIGIESTIIGFKKK